MMSPKFDDAMEMISPEDIEQLIDELQELLIRTECRTYDFNITSDSVPQREETHS